MRDDVGILNRLPVRDFHPNGLPSSVNDTSALGFTALNGHAPRRPSAVADETAPRSISVLNAEFRPRTDGAQSSPSTLSEMHQAHNWRPREDNQKVPETTEPLRDRLLPAPVISSKRKRAHSGTDDMQDRERRNKPAGSPPHSPTSRLIDNKAYVPSSTRTRIIERNELEPASAESYLRQASPIYKKGRRTPPPPPEPEIERALAEQVQQFAGRDQSEAWVEHAQKHFSDQGHTDERTRSMVGSVAERVHQEQLQQRHLDDQGSSPPEQPDSTEQNADADDHENRQFSPGDNAGETSDSKKRKRNFTRRTKTGCHTCRRRKKKCDEAKPHCQNCVKGGFGCGGYGPKPIGGGPKMPAGSRLTVPIQAKQHIPYTQATSEPPELSLPQDGSTRAPIPAPVIPAPRYDDRAPLPKLENHAYAPHRWPYPVSPSDTRPSSVRNWENRPSSHWAANAPPEPAVFPVSNERAYNEFPNVPPPPPMHHFPPIYPGPTSFPAQQLPAPMSYRPPTAAASTVIASQTSGGSVGGGSGGSSSTSSGHGSYHASMMQAPLAPGGYKSERAKMLEGKLYKHFHDEELKDERLSCKRALEAFNDANKGSSTLSSAQREQFFPPIINPKTRPDKKFLNWDGPQGSVGSYTTVESPFSCEFGYNIHLGNRVFIGEGCTLQDARKIRIGNNTIIGPNVKFYCLTTSVDATQRAGCQGEFYAGPITVEDHVFIGADSIIMPFRTIGRGAVVGAGSVVTRDVKPNTVVAGNPAKTIRKKIKPGPDADRHEEEIEEQNEEMQKKDLRNELIPRPGSRTPP